MTTKVPNAMLATPGSGGGGLTVSDATASITVSAATHNGNVLATTSASAVSLVLNTGVALTSGMVVEQRGAGLVTLSGTASFVSPNGLATSGINTTMSIIPTEAANTYLVLVNRTSDQTLINATAGATPAVNLALYNVVDLTLTANCTPAFSGASSGQAFSVTLILRQDGTGSRTLTLPAATKWAGGVAPTYTTTAGAINVITMMTVDGGSNWLGFPGGVGFA